MKRRYLSILVALALALAHLGMAAGADDSGPGLGTVMGLTAKDGGGPIHGEEVGGRYHIYPTIDDGDLHKTIHITGRAFAGVESHTDGISAELAPDGLTVTVSGRFRSANPSPDLTATVGEEEDPLEIVVAPSCGWEVTVAGNGTVAVKGSEAYSVGPDESDARVADLGPVELSIKAGENSAVGAVSITDRSGVSIANRFDAADGVYKLKSAHEDESITYVVKVDFVEDSTPPPKPEPEPEPDPGPDPTPEPGPAGDVKLTAASGGNALLVEKGTAQRLEAPGGEALPEGAPTGAVPTYRVYVLADDNRTVTVKAGQGIQAAGMNNGKASATVQNDGTLRIVLDSGYTSNTSAVKDTYKADLYAVTEDGAYFNLILYPAALWEVTVAEHGTVTVYENMAESEKQRDGGQKHKITGKADQVFTEIDGFDVMFDILPDKDYQIKDVEFSLDDKNLEEEGEDKDKARSVRAAGLESRKYTLKVTFEDLDESNKNTEKPATPVLKAEVNGDNDVVLTWDKVDRAVTYHVNRSAVEDKNYSLVGENVITTTYVDAGLEQGTYYYYIVAVNEVDIGENSNTVKVEVGEGKGDGGDGDGGGQEETLAPPRLELGAATESAISLRWGGVDGADGYRVYWGLNDYAFEDSAATMVTGYQIKELAPDTEYYIYAVAYKGDVESKASNLVTATTVRDEVAANALGAPVNLRITGTTSTSISLAWDEVGGAAGYKMYWNTSTAGTFTSNEVSGGGCTVYSLDGGTMYYLYVTAVDADGEEGNASITLAAKTIAGGGTAGSAAVSAGSYAVSTSKTTEQVEVQPDYAFRVNQSLNRFQDAYIDGQKLTRGGDYTLREGSTILVLDEAFVESLDEGRHTLRMDFSDATGTTEFEVATETGGAGAEILPADSGSVTNGTLNPNSGC